MKKLIQISDLHLLENTQQAFYMRHIKLFFARMNDKY